MEYSKQSAVGFIALALTGILALGLAVTEVLAGPLKPALANIRTWIMMGETSILFLWLWFCLCREDKKWLRTAGAVGGDSFGNLAPPHIPALCCVWNVCSPSCAYGKADPASAPSGLPSPAGTESFCLHDPGKFLLDHSRMHGFPDRKGRNGSLALFSSAHGAGSCSYRAGSKMEGQEKKG